MLKSLKQSRALQGFSQAFPSYQLGVPSILSICLVNIWSNGQERVNSSRYQLKHVLCFEITLGICLFHSLANFTFYLLLCTLHNSIPDRKCLRGSHAKKGFPLTQKGEFRYTLKVLKNVFWSPIILSGICMTGNKSCSQGDPSQNYALSVMHISSH